MSSAAAAIQLDASADRVWQVIADLGGYRVWNPCFRDVRGTLRANDLLDVELRLPDSGLGTRTVSARVLDVYRRRYLRWVLVSPAVRPAAAPPGERELGVYDVEVVPLGPAQVRLAQRLALEPEADGETADRSELMHLVEAMNDALRDRVAWVTEHLSPDCQIDGTIRVSSRTGLTTQGGQQRPGLVSRLAGVLHGRRTRPAA